MEEARRGRGNHACSTHYYKCSYHTRLVCTTHQRSVPYTLLFGCAYYTFMTVCYAHHKRCAYRGIGRTPYLVYLVFTVYCISRHQGGPHWHCGLREVERYLYVHYVQQSEVETVLSVYVNKRVLERERERERDNTAL